MTDDERPKPRRYTLLAQAAAVEYAAQWADPPDHALNAARITMRLLADHDEGLRALIGHLRRVGGIQGSDDMLGNPAVRHVLETFPDAILSTPHTADETAPMNAPTHEPTS